MLRRVDLSERPHLIADGALSLSLSLASGNRAHNILVLVLILDVVLPVVGSLHWSALWYASLACCEPHCLLADPHGLMVDSLHRADHVLGRLAYVGAHTMVVGPMRRSAMCWASLTSGWARNRPVGLLGVCAAALHLTLRHSRSPSLDVFC